MTGFSFAICFSIWSMPGSVSSTTIVIREWPSTVVGPTVRLSMLNWRRETSPETRASTPGSSSTSAEMTARRDSCSASTTGSIRIPSRFRRPSG